MNKFGKEEGKRLARAAHELLIDETRIKFFNGEWVDWSLWLDADLDEYDLVCEEDDGPFTRAPGGHGWIRLRPDMLEKMRNASREHNPIEDQSDV